MAVRAILCLELQNVSCGVVQCKPWNLVGQDLWRGVSGRALKLENKGFRAVETCFPQAAVVRYSIQTGVSFWKSRDNCLRRSVGVFITGEDDIQNTEAVRMGSTLCAVRRPGVPHFSSRYGQPLTKVRTLLMPILQ